MVECLMMKLLNYSYIFFFGYLVFKWINDKKIIKKIIFKESIV